MKQLFILLFTLLALSAQSQNVRAYLSYNTFYSSKEGPYIETYVSIDGTSVEWKKNGNNLYQAQLELTIIFEQDTNVINYSKVIVKGDEVKDSAGMNIEFMNTQRFALPNGEYKLKVKIDDLNDTLHPEYIISPLAIYVPDTSASISSIEAVKTLSKTTKAKVNSHSGFDMIPNIYNYFPVKDSIFTFYAELYHIDKSIGANEPYIMNYYISNFESNTIIPKYKKFERRTAKEIDAILGQFDISGLASGNFVFTIELINRDMKLITKGEYFFQRDNPNVKLEADDIESVNVINTFAELITGKDTLEDILLAMEPISTEPENEFIKYIIKQGDEHVMQQYIYNYWQKRNPLEPSKPFVAYMIEVMRVNREFGTSIKKGYETDRGIVYLKYGQPNSIMKQYHEPATYPYEIWHYYGIRGQGNVKFVFYNTDLATNDFELLHSNAIGEINNYRWKLTLRKRDKGFNSVDETGGGFDEWGTHYEEYYEQPR